MVGAVGISSFGVWVPLYYVELYVVTVAKVIIGRGKLITADH